MDENTSKKGRLQQVDGPWKCGNEFLPYHPAASHVSPEYRDGWNACYRAAQELLEPYQNAENAALVAAQRRDRAEAIGSALFPRYDSVSARRNPEEKPPQWHEKSWWWNNVSVDWDSTDIEPIHPAEITLALKSYVGGGEMDATTVRLPAAWLEEDNWSEPLAKFVAAKTKEREVQKAAKDAAEAQRDIERARETLRRLTGESA